MGAGRGWGRLLERGFFGDLGVTCIYSCVYTSIVLNKCIYTVRGTCSSILMY